MKSFKELGACKARLRAILARSDIEPEQKQAVQKAYDALTRLGRQRNLTHAQIARCVREVVDWLIEAFIRKP
jgi:hypothetical protein